MIRTYVVNNQQKGQVIINSTDLKEIGRINDLNNIIRKTIKIDVKQVFNKTLNNVTELEIVNYVNSLNILVKNNELYNIELFEPVTPINFSIQADWNTIQDFPVTDQSSFEIFLKQRRNNWNYNNLTNIVITDFSLNNGLLECNLNVTGTNLDLGNIGISQINGIGNITNLQTLYLDNNNISNFDILLPGTLTFLQLTNNQIVDFNPTIPLPSNLQYLELNNNQIVDFNPTIPLPSNLQFLYLNNNLLTIFNPSISLPITLMELNISQNQISTDSIITMEDWANLQNTFNYCDVYFNSNPISSMIIGSNLQTILYNKNASVSI